MLEKLAFLLLGVLITLLVQQYRLARSEDASMISEHIRDIEKLSEALENYWLLKPESELEERVGAARVRSKHAATSHLYPLVSRICDRRSEEFERLSLQLYQVGLGGPFETSDRDIDPERAIQSHDLATQIVHLLRSVRAELHSFSRLGISAVCRTKWAIEHARAFIARWRK